MKKIRIITALLTALLGISAFSAQVSAEEPIDIRLNGNNTEVGALLIGKTTYVPFDSANEALSFGAATVYGTPEDMRSVSPFASIKASKNNCYLEAEGRYFGVNNTVVVSGMLYVPIRALAKAYDAEVVWDDTSRSVDLYATESKVIEHGDSYYSSDAVYWLSRIIHAEAGAEPMSGKIMVGNVVLNRVNSPDFPNTIYSVIFDKKHGIQFTPTINGMIYNTPGEDSIIAAKLCLDSYFLSKDALYFLNPALSTSLWIPNNRPYLTTIGSHHFYA